MAEVPTEPIAEAAKYSIVHLCRQIGYIVDSKKNLQNYTNKVNELRAMREGVEQLVQIARRRGDLMKPVVKAWLTRVVTLQNEEIELTGKDQEINRWYKGWCCSRYHVGKEAKEKIGNTDALLNEGKSFISSDTVSDPAPAPPIESLPTVDFHPFASREDASKQIIEALQDVTINVVGVYGMGGVGKTALMKKLGKQVKRDHLFDEVVMVTVSQTPNLKKIQDDIAEDLGMEKLEMRSKTGRAGRLSTRLKDERRVLIILDDVWEKLDFSEVGIPLGDDHKGCKVVLTTRNQDVCNDMEAQAKIKIEVLSEQDSWILFRQKAVVDSPALETLAKDVAKECSGLPLAIITLGLALRDKDHKVWKDALRQLGKSIFFQSKSPVFSSIELSYNYLESQEIKQCFLFCCLFPEGYNISEDTLMWYVMGEELLPNVDTLDEARGRFHKVVEKLISSCLLLKGDEDGRVRMHDVVRDAALTIASEESNRFVVKAGLELQWWPDKENLRMCKRMSLRRNKISQLPDDPECLQLLTLSLSENSLTVFPDRFFERMISLVTLDLGHNNISSLPPSIVWLVNLRTLCLENNPLRDVSRVGTLKKLEILILSGTEIQFIPEEITELTNLKLLDLSETYDLQTIPRKMLSSFSRLEELYMLGSFSWWEIEGMGDGSKASLEDLTSLNCLTILHASVYDTKCFSTNISKFLENLTKFHIAVGTLLHRSSKFTRVMNFTTAMDQLPNSIKVLLKKTDELVLYHCEGLKNVVKLDAGDFNNLKSLSIQKCLEMESMTNVVKKYLEPASSVLDGGYSNAPRLSGRQSHSSSEHEPFKTKHSEGMCHHAPKAQYMSYSVPVKPEDAKKRNQSKKHFCEDNYPGLDKRASPFLAIYGGSVPNTFLEQLKFLEVDQCHKITNVLYFDLLAGLHNLEILRVYRCDELKEVFLSKQLDQKKRATMPSLRNMRLGNLPKLMAIWNGIIPLICFQGLTTMEVSHCERLSYLFSRTMVQRLQKLEVLKIWSCSGMEKIIKSEEEERAVEKDETVLPRLMTLILDELPVLSSFYQLGPLFFDWPSLEVLRVVKCPNLNKLPLATQSAPRLRVIYGDSVEWFEGLRWEDNSIKSRLQPLFKQVNS